jgi:hypothetical protein
MLDKSPKEPVRHCQTIAPEIYMDFASSFTDANWVWLRAWRIALSITSGGSLNAALRSESSSETRQGRKSQSNMRLHRIRGSTRVHHGPPGLKVPSCWDRDKLCIDTFCHMLSFNINFHFLQKEITSPWPQNKIWRFCFREICSYDVGYKSVLLDSKPGG